MNTQNDFVDFNEFLKQTATANLDQHRALTAMPVGSSAFEEMQAHVLSLYKDVPVKHSFLGQDGHYIDCIAIDGQPGLRATNGQSKIAEPPTPSSLPIASSESASPGQAARPSGIPVEPQLKPGDYDQFGNEQFCPPGTIPMQRITLDKMTPFGNLATFLRPRLGFTPKVSSAEARTAQTTQSTASSDPTYLSAGGYQRVKNNGSAARFNLWKPIPTTNECSVDYVMHFDNKELQVVQSGWAVYPPKFNTDNPVLFIYWQADGKPNSGNYNLDQPAFVQTNHSWVLGASLLPVSVPNGAQFDLWMQWEQDTSNGNWWLFLPAAGGTQLAAVGYYPKALFGSGPLSQSAEAIAYYGMVSGTTTSGQMGSGEPASAGWQKAAYMRSIYYVPENATSLSPATLSAYVPNPNCYTIDIHNNSGDPNWGTYLFYGGNSCTLAGTP